MHSFAWIHSFWRCILSPVLGIDPIYAVFKWFWVYSFTHCVFNLGQSLLATLTMKTGTLHIQSSLLHAARYLVALPLPMSLEEAFWVCSVSAAEITDQIHSCWSFASLRTKYILVLFKMKASKLVLKEQLLAKPPKGVDKGCVSFVFPVFSVSFGPETPLLIWAVCCWSMALALRGRQMIGRSKIKWKIFFYSILISLLLCMELSDVPSRHRTSFSLALCSHRS